MRSCFKMCLVAQTAFSPISLFPNAQQQQKKSHIGKLNFISEMSPILIFKYLVQNLIWETYDDALFCNWDKLLKCFIYA